MIWGDAEQAAANWNYDPLWEERTAYLRADLAAQHEDAAQQARGDQIREPGYRRGLDDELIAREDQRREAEADAAIEAREARWDQ